MIDTIDLSNYEFGFSDSELANLKRKNFIYGKNGTGKSSIVNAIKEQYSDIYDIKVFNGWRGVIRESDYLDAIALGEKNTARQIEIDGIDEKLIEIDNEIIENPDGTVNLFKKQQQASANFAQQNRKIEKFFTDSARTITSKLSLGRSYNKPNFKEDITNANLLSESEIKKLGETVKAQKIEIGERKYFPKIDLKKYLEATNEILQTIVLPSGVLRELTDNVEKQSFAKLGMKIHDRENHNEKCSFCGTIISDDRWKELDRYFSEEVVKLDTRILEGIKNIEDCTAEINKVSVIDETEFYPEYKELIQNLNVEILEFKSSYDNFLTDLKSSLEEKKQKTIVKIDKIESSVPETFSALQVKYDELYEKNKNYSTNLVQEQKSALRRLRFHEVKNILDEFKYPDEDKILEGLKIKKELVDKEFSNLKDMKKDFLQKRKELIADTTKEITTAIKINKFLKGLGAHSFSLDHIESSDGQKGQYRVLDINGDERSVQTLSDGEKNIVAFLWFMDSLEGSPTEGETPKEKIVIFDDPMNSNDDACQYLMMGVIQRFYRQPNHPQLFLMTHNNHFYLQVTPNQKKYPTQEKPNPEQKYIRLIKVGDKTTIKIISSNNENIKSIYDELWEELKFAYDQNKVIFMWNNMRRILETYSRFTFKNNSPSDIENQIEDITDKALAIALVKSLNVNSHVGYETDIDISGKSRDDLKNIFSHIFDKISASKHFNSYWQT